MTDPAADAARPAAAILAPYLGPGLPAEVEAALAARDAGQRPGRYLDPVSLAGLIVAIALAWTIYNDRRKHTPDPPPDAIARQVRITLRDQDTALPPRHRADHRNRCHRDHPSGQTARVAVRPRRAGLRCYSLRRPRPPPDRPADVATLHCARVQRPRVGGAAAAQATP